MRVFVVGPTDHGRYAYPVLPALRKRGVEVVFLQAPKVSGADATSLWSSESAIRQWSKTFRLGNLLKDGDHVFLTDFWNPGVLGIAYGIWARGLEAVKVYGNYCASSALPGDFAEQLPFAKYAEESWGRCYEHIFCPTRWAQTQLSSDWPTLVTGQPFYAPTGKVPSEREPLILFPHRGTPDKFPPRTLGILRAVLSRSAARVAISFEVPELERDFSSRVLRGPFARQQLEELQMQSRVTLCTSDVETFGYSWMEGAVRGSVPIAPNSCAYAELVPRVYLYDDSLEAIDLILKHLRGQESPPRVASQFREILHPFSQVANLWADTICAEYSDS